MNIVELPHVEHLGKSRFRIGDLLSRSIARSRAMNIDLEMNTEGLLRRQQAQAGDDLRQRRRARGYSTRALDAFDAAAEINPNA